MGTLRSGQIIKKLLKSRISLAFTLAEVLITLGILGVVAALTIPGLVNKINDIQHKSAAKEAFSKVSQAVQQMKVDEGGSLDTYHDTTIVMNNFAPVFKKYFKVVKDCDLSSCVSGVAASTVYSTLAGNPGDTADMGNNGQFITADGMFFNIQQDGYNANAKIIIVVDVNNYTKKPNVFGRDTFAFQLIGDNLLTMGAAGTVLEDPSFCARTGTGNRIGLGCMYKVMQGEDY